MIVSCSEVQQDTVNSISMKTVQQSVPTLERGKHEVPLQHILFDTFSSTGSRILPLTEAAEEQVTALRDVIPPLHFPEYLSVTEVTWLRESDLIIGYASGDDAWAYPVKILNYHEIVNDELAGDAVLITYCPLCRSGIVYNREVDHQTHHFGNTSALYESGMVMLDYETGSYWWQVSGQSIAGTLSGKTLHVLPSTTTQWKEWKRMYPDTKILSWYTGYTRQYMRDSFSNIAHALNQKNFMFPVSQQAMDDRLPSGSIVLVVYVGGHVKAYPILESGNTVIHDRIGNEDLTVFINAKTETATAFYSKLEDESYRFRWQGNGIIDTNTKSLWDFTGKAVAGKLSGKQLIQLPSKYMFWFAAIASEPDIQLYPVPKQ